MYARPELLEDFRSTPDNDNRALIRTVYDLSDLDKANIALLHPGKRLDSEAITAAGTVLDLKYETVQKLLKLAVEYKWRAIRKTYLESLKEPLKEWTKYKEAAAKLIQLNTRHLEYPLRKSPNTPAKGTAPPRSRGPEPRPDPKQGESKSVESPGLLETLYKQLSQKIGPSGAQILTLQFPTRYLAKEEFQYELSGIYSNFVKPVVVSEAEFRLTDMLYDPAPIVSAPNGRSLSTVYHQVINNFVPKYDEADRKARQERERIRTWLLMDVNDSYYKFDYNTSGGGLGENRKILDALNSQLPQENSMVRKMSRMEFASQLTQGKFSMVKLIARPAEGLNTDVLLFCRILRSSKEVGT